jgi:hypothetical protein
VSEVHVDPSPDPTSEPVSDTQLAQPSDAGTSTDIGGSGELLRETPDAPNPGTAEVERPKVYIICKLTDTPVQTYEVVQNEETLTMTREELISHHIQELIHYLMEVSFAHYWGCTPVP